MGPPDTDSARVGNGAIGGRIAVKAKWPGAFRLHRVGGRHREIGLSRGRGLQATLGQLDT